MAGMGFPYKCVKNEASRAGGDYFGPERQDEGLHL
jgi:hypothetical protein